MNAAPRCSHSMTLSVQRPAIQPHDAATPTSHSRGDSRDSVAMTPKAQPWFRQQMFTDFYSFLFCSLSPHLSSRSRNAPFMCSSVTLVGSRCAGLEYTPTSALLCSRGGILAPTGGCPWDNRHGTSCYWPFFFLFRAMLSVVKSFPVEKMIMFACFVCSQPWLCHVTSHFSPHWLSCQQYI